MSESRFDIEASKNFTWIGFLAKSDFYYDGYLDQFIVDLREANVSITPLKWLDLKIGRQILTWGVGDLLFINDLFPKDWKSYLMGREESYLKAPSNSLKATVYTEIFNVDFIYNPLFEPNRYIEGERISFWDISINSHRGRDNQISTEEPNEWFAQDEISTRIFKNINGYEIAIYFYDGYWKDPTAYDMKKDKMTFSDLSAYGLSFRGEILSGILSLEMGYYDSKEDRDGDDFMVMNSQWLFLLGYEKEIFRDFTIGMQYYLEYMSDYGAYKRTLPENQKPEDELRHVITMRLNYLMLNQNLTLSLFSYFSPSDMDAFIRPIVKYKISDNWAVDIGSNVFLGKYKHTFFGEFKRNTSIYAGLRFNF